MMRRIGVILTASAMAFALMAGQARAGVEIRATFDRPVTLSLQTSATECSNRGASIEIEGSISLGAVDVKMTLQNNAKGTHSNTVVGEGTLAVAPATAVSIPKQPVLGGVGGNPKIWLRVLDDRGRALTSYLYLGRCVQGTNLETLQTLLAVPAVARAFFTSISCSNKGSSINIDSSANTAGINAQIVFTNNDHFTHETGPQDAVALVDLNAPMTSPKSGALGGAGGNPLVYGNFMIGGQNLTDPQLLGRCNKI